MLQFGEYKMDTNEIINQLREENERLNLRLKNQEVMITANLGVSGQIKKAAFELGYHGSMEATELDYLIETARASVMVNQKNAELQSQLVAVQDSVVHGKCANSEPCATFCEAISTRKMFKQLQVERDALAAQVKALAANLKEASSTIGNLSHNFRGRMGDDALFAMAKKADEWNYTCKATPQYHLAEHDEGVAANAYRHCLNHYSTLKPSSFSGLIDSYVIQLRAKVGKQ